MYIRCLFLFLFLLSYPHNNSTAETVEVDFTFTIHLFDDDKGKDLDNFSIQIFEDGKLRKKVLTDADGLAKFYCKLDKEYKIVIVGNEEYVEKLLVIDTRNVDLHGWKHKATPQVSLKYDVAVRLFKKNPKLCQDFSFLKEEPVFYLKYDTEYEDFHDMSTIDLEKRIKDERKKKC